MTQVMMCHQRSVSDDDTLPEFTGPTGGSTDCDGDVHLSVIVTKVLQHVFALTRVRHIVWHVKPTDSSDTLKSIM